MENIMDGKYNGKYNGVRKISVLAEIRFQASQN